MDTRKESAPTVGSDVATIYVGIELSGQSWLAGVESPLRERMRAHKLQPSDVTGLCRLIEGEEAALVRRGYRRVRVVSCYEAGRDGFWPHRFLVARGVESWVVDPGSVLVNRRARRAKSDRLDLEGLLRVLKRHDNGADRLGEMVRVPSVAEEDARRPQRERQRLVSERGAHVNRIKGLLATHGVYAYRPLRADRWERLADLRGVDGVALPEQVRAEIERELRRLEFVEEQIAALERRRQTALAGAAVDDAVAAQLRALMRLKGIGIEIASVLVGEVYYRSFASRRHVASYFGLTPSPYRSGSMEHEQGIAKAGNRRARSTAIELAWLWLRHQPESELSRWFRARLLKTRSRRLKRILIVALARKLVVALWRYLTTGLMPEGARMKA
jgi:transposase